MAQPLRIDDLPPMIPDTLLQGIFAFQDAVSETARRQLDEIEATERRFFAQWPEMMARVKAHMVLGHGYELDGTIENIRKHEVAMATRLAEFRRQQSAVKEAISPSVKSAQNRVEESLLRNVEFLRDMRWDLVNVRIDSRLPSDALPVTSLAQLRKMVRAG